jgi:hypothetical protein
MRLHDWAFATQSWRRQHGEEGGERNADADVVVDVDGAADRLSAVACRPREQ